VNARTSLYPDIPQLRSLAQIFVLTLPSSRMIFPPFTATGFQTESIPAIGPCGEDECPAIPRKHGRGRHADYVGQLILAG
jgi:hypothetical protein